MAQPTNLFDRYAQVGVREDLEDIIYDISPEETPVVSMLKRTKAKQTYHEWQTNTIATANANNAAVEGDDAILSARTPTSRVGNYTQIFVKNIGVSETAIAVDAAGRDDELKYQLANAGRELKTDIEASVCSANAAVAGNSTTARKSAGLETMIAVNLSSGAGGSTAAWASGAATVAPTDGTQRAFTEALLKTVLLAGVQNGMRTKALILGPGQKQVFSTFVGNAVNRIDNPATVKQLTIVAGADVYLSDFGKLMVTMDLFSRNRTALLVDPEYASVAVLRPMQKIELAKTGDSTKYQMKTELCSVVSNPKAHAKVADLT